MEQHWDLLLVKKTFKKGLMIDDKHVIFIMPHKTVKKGVP